MFLLLVAASWYAMLVVHECGHILAAWATGGRVERVVLVPWAFSRTDLALNPHPVIVAWAGPLFGAIIPAIVSPLVRSARSGWVPAWYFFAGFCLLANGVYLGAAALLPVGDSEDLMRLGMPSWVVTAAGVPLVILGLRLWHTIGRRPGDRVATTASR